jgi:hypothetical protein
MSSNLYSAAVSLNERCMALAIADTRKLSDFSALYYAPHADSQPRHCNATEIEISSYCSFSLLRLFVIRHPATPNTCTASSR